MKDHHDEKKSPIKAEGDCSVCEYGGALESLVRDMYGAWCATVDDCYAQNIDGYYERMAELGIEVGE